MAKHRTRVGLHARNAVHLTELDYQLVRRAKIETLKMMSFTDISVYQRLRKENPNIQFIVRLYDERITRDSRPSPAAFVSRMIPTIKRLKPYTDSFEIHNEPNHVSGLEGWGPSDDNARAFQAWYLQVLSQMKKACPWAEFGFPGLALNHPHRDLAWLDMCRNAILASDWLGCHCYWQYGNMLSPQWGLRFQLYGQRFPEKRIEITEFGNSTPNLPRQEIANQYVRYYQELNKYPYLGSASSFIASSPDPTWAGFVWMKEGGEMQPVVDSVGNMERKPEEVTPWPKPPSPRPKPEPPSEPKRTFPQTGKTVRGNFLQFFDQYGLDICGYPITEQFEEEGLQSQYFQRIALEEHDAGQIQLKTVGSEAWGSRPRLDQLKARIEELGQMFLSFGPGMPPMHDLVGELPTHPTRRYDTRSLADIEQLVIHHTATGPRIAPQRLAQYQVQKQGRPGIVYHFLIAVDGTIYQTNRLETISDHAYERNRSSIGICFPGNFTRSIPTAAQLEAGGQLCAWLTGALRLPISAIVGVGEFAPTQSPGKQWLGGQRWKDKLLDRVRAASKAKGYDQAALVSSFQQQVASLQAEINELQQGTSTSFALAFAPEGARVTKPPIKDVIHQLPRHSEKTYKSRSLEDIEYLVIHHSAVPASAGPTRIATYHIKKHDWPGIGYHFTVGDDGTIHQCNPLESISYHAVRANARGVGICFLGNFTDAVPTPDQLRAGGHLVAWLMQELGIDDVRGHKEFMDTACPGKQWLEGQKWKTKLFTEMILVQQAARQPIPSEPPADRLLYHYMLFPASDMAWAESDWHNAQNYIRAFRPTVGFLASDAARAEYVTIVGGTLGVSEEVEAQLKAAGCKVERIAGQVAGDTKRILNGLVQQGKRFQTFEE